MAITLELTNFDPPIIPDDWFAADKRLPGTVAAYGPGATMGPPATLPDVIGSADMTMFNRTPETLNQPATVAAVTFPYGRTYNGVNQYEGIDSPIIAAGTGTWVEMIFSIPNTASQTPFAMGKSANTAIFGTLVGGGNVFVLVHRNDGVATIVNSSAAVTVPRNQLNHLLFQKISDTGWKWILNGVIGTASQTAAYGVDGTFTNTRIGVLRTGGSDSNFMSGSMAPLAVGTTSTLTDTQLRNRWEQLNYLWRANPGQTARTVTAPSFNTYASRKSLPQGLARVGYERSLPAGDFTIEIPYLQPVGGIVPIGQQNLASQGTLIVESNALNKTVTVKDDETPILSGDIPLAEGQWNVVHLTRSGTTAKLYINGVLDETGTIATVPDEILKVGGDPETPFGLSGRVRVWDTALTAEEITIATNEINAAVGRLQNTTGSGFGLGLGFD